jgi:hypothetical protein
MDKLITFLEALPHGELSKFARRAGLCPTYLWRIKNGQKGVGLKVACKLVEASDGALTLDDFLHAPSKPATAEAA